MLISDLIYVTDQHEFLFVVARERYWYADLQKGKKPEFIGPFNTYREARIAAWAIMALNSPLLESLLSEVGYAWDRWVVTYSEIFKAELRRAQKGYTS